MSGRNERIYLDHNATAPLLDEARDAAMAALDLANPSSTHREGRAARAAVEAARAGVARLVGGAEGNVPAENVVFTSGATEAATQLLSPRWLLGGQAATIGALAVLETDHPATREGGRFDPAFLTRLPVDRHGVVDEGALAAWAERAGAGGTAMLALSWANSETGVLQPLEAIRAILDARRGAGRILLVLDAAQVAGRLAVDLVATGADALILSGHKMGAAKGVGAIALKDVSTRPFALLRGGGQERGMRAGTEALPAIASFGAAAAALAPDVAVRCDRLAAMRRGLEAALTARLPQALILGGAAERLPNTVAVAHPGVKAETAQIALDLAGIAVSAGSACASGKVGPSHVVAAMAGAGLAVDPGLGAIRVSFGAETKEGAFERFVCEYEKLALRAASRVGATIAA
ncbi:cysteine desulfurase family protein [Jiella sonneratiae]|uniref:Cysteine desulfurase n=1 Tax=Jiella sonneratiae TaxID=2816856 RepID=A0ABS3IXC3_9HYPH|nr:aminotransferase class V-fold PLP-dependent enzyme [Jiella sonneratiae]MBO0902059.1 aminotransferase class V-fold PLP-dependent enzyme [Jiella sonneratiae]